MTAIWVHFVTLDCRFVIRIVCRNPLVSLFLELFYQTKADESLSPLEDKDIDTVHEQLQKLYLFI